LNAAATQVIFSPFGLYGDDVIKNNNNHNRK
jgi:hypothetical protein